VDGETDIASDSFLLSRTQFARDVAVSDCRLSLWRGNRKAGRPDARPEPSTRGAALPWAPFPRARLWSADGCAPAAGARFPS